MRGVITVVSLLAIWEILARMGVTNPLILPSPLEIAAALAQLLTTQDGDSPSLLKDIAASLKRVLVGLMFAHAAAIPLAITLAVNRTLADHWLPVVELLRPIPPAAWIPMAILWFGIGNQSSYFITTIAGFFPLFVNTFAGVRGVDPSHLHAARSLGASGRQLVLHVMLPSILPYLVTGIRISVGTAWMSLIAAELIAAESGLGYMLQLHRMMLETPKVMVGVGCIGLLGLLMNWALLRLERLALPWRE